MGFTTTTFLFIFFPFSIAGYYLSMLLEKNISFLKRLHITDCFLVFVGLAFYSWAITIHSLYLIGYIIVIYFLGLIIKKLPSKYNLKILAIGIIFLLGVLYYYKYHLFVAFNLNNIFDKQIIPFNSEIAVPLGISFITFSAISYIMDISRKDANSGTILDCALYITFFPKIVSGPIVLWRDFSKKMKERVYNTDRFVSGLNRIMIGFGKKLILADSFGAVCHEIQMVTDKGIDVPTAWGCAILYMFQIYFDFAGYSDIAIGLGRLFGFDMEENFNFPYMSLSITDFWRRWHISLGTWFREYLYYPLGGNRKGKFRTLINLGIVFFITGLWHGAGWVYIFWGLLHGMCRIIEKCIDKTKFYRRIPTFIKYTLTMFVVMIGWEAFRINSFTELISYFKIMFGMVNFTWIPYSFTYFFNIKVLFLVFVSIIGSTVFSLPVIKSIPNKINKSTTGFVIQELFVFIIMIIAILFMVNSTYSPFIYFQY